MEDKSSESSDEFPSSDSHFPLKLDPHQPSYDSHLIKFEDNFSRPTSNCSTLINSGRTPTHSPDNITDDGPAVETPVNAATDIHEGKPANQ